MDKVGVSRLLRSVLAGIVLTLASSTVHASIIQFNAVGSADVTGYVLFDDSAFPGGSFDFVSNSAITGLSLTVFGFTFSFGDVVTTDSTIINSSGVIPLIVNGAGALAFNGTETIAFFPDGFGGTAFDGDASLTLDTDGSFGFGGSGWEEIAAVRWEASPVPEPGTMLLLGSGLLSFAARRRRRTS
jgi:hypothetical protein